MAILLPLTDFRCVSVKYDGIIIFISNQANIRMRRKNVVDALKVAPIASSCSSFLGSLVEHC